MFKWLARMFTIPKAVRKQIDNNPVVEAIGPTIYADLINSIDTTVSKNISNPVVADALKSALALGLEHAGISATVPKP